MAVAAEPDARQTPTVRVRVWDAPLRIFHGLLLAAVATAIATGLAGGDWMTWHARAGLAIVGLLAFRLAWGLVGSPTSRFSYFLPTPARVKAYLQGRWHGIGHNPLGALSVIALLTLLGAQVGTGLFSNDDIAFSGPLAPLLSEEQVSAWTGWHRWIINGLYGLIGLHLAAIAFHAIVKRDPLVPPMVTGWKRLPPEQAAQAPDLSGGTRWRRTLAWVLALALAAAAVWWASGAWIASPPPAAPATGTQAPAAPTPTW